jgi:hypothetical protein
MVQIVAKKNAKKQKTNDVQEIINLLEKQGYRKITEEEEQTEEYKKLFERPECFDYKS